LLTAVPRFLIIFGKTRERERERGEREGEVF